MFDFLRPQPASNIGKLTEDIEILKSKIKIMELSQDELFGKVQTALKRVDAKLGMAQLHEKRKDEKEQLQNLVVTAGLDMSNPQEAIKKAMENPELMSFVMKKLVGDML